MEHDPHCLQPCSLGMVFCFFFFPPARGTSEVFTFEKNHMSCTHAQPIYAWLCPGANRNKINWSRKAAPGSFIGSAGSCLFAKSCPTLRDSMDSSPPGSMGFSRQEYWSWLSFPSSGDLPNPGTELVSLALVGGFFMTEPPGKPSTGRSWKQM